jgi:putative oxidoreductase
MLAGQLAARRFKMNNVTVLVGRILLSAIFILSGFAKLTDINGTAAYFSMYHLPGGVLTAVVVGLVELLGGLAILIGFQTRIAAWLLAVFSVASALVAHMDWADMMQLINFQKNLAMAGGFLLLATYGPGALSVDARRGWTLVIA